MASPSVDMTDPFFIRVKRVREKMRAKFFRIHQALKEIEAALLSELDELVDSYTGDRVKEQIRELEQLRNSLSSNVQHNENQETVASSILLMDSKIGRLQVTLETRKNKLRGVVLDWNREVEERLSEIGRIRVISREISETEECLLDSWNVKLCEVKTGAELFRSNRDESRTVSFPHPKGMCCLCSKDNIGLEMHCGHFICPEDLLENAWDQINLSEHTIHCVCGSIISLEDILKFGLPNEDEKQFLTTTLSLNYFQNLLDTQFCPNCSSCCERINFTCPKMECIVCKRKGEMNYTFCWYCLEEWKGATKKDCGNSNCLKGKPVFPKFEMGKPM